MPRVLRKAFHFVALCYRNTVRCELCSELTNVLLGPLLTMYDILTLFFLFPEILFFVWILLVS
jgi:hypothetical protein